MQAPAVSGGGGGGGGGAQEGITDKSYQPHMNYCYSSFAIACSIFQSAMHRFRSFQ